MRRGLGKSFVPALSLMVTVGACNAILDNHDRVLDDLGDARTPPRGDGSVDPPSNDATADGTVNPTIPPPPPSPPPQDGSINDGATILAVPMTVANFSTPNGATFGAPAGGMLQITNFSTFNHPAIVATSPAITAEDYTITAVIRAPSNSEFGLLARFQGDNSCAVLGSKYGTTNEPFIGYLSATDWNPVFVAGGPVYTYSANAHYGLELKVVGNVAYGKIWDFNLQARPVTPQVAGTIPWATGRSAGFYVYAALDAVLEAMEVTVP